MSCRARDWAWRRKGLTLAQRVVLLALAEHADENGASCFPSLGLLERMTELSRRGITKALSGLDGTLIERDRGGPGRATRYRLLVQEPNDSDGEVLGREPSSPNTSREQASLGNPVAEVGEPSSLSGAGEHSSLGNRVPKGRELSSPGREHSALSVGNPVPPNRHMNRHRTVSEPLLRSDADDRPSTRTDKGQRKAEPIPPDWQPGERVFAWAAKQGMTREWVQAQVDEFLVYWSDAGTRRKSWDATFINRLQTLQAKPRQGPRT
jgi:hypothetical protein